MVVRASDGPRRTHALPAALAVWCLFGSTPANAADRVVIQKPGSTGKVVIEGRIEDFSAAGLELKPAAGGPIQRFSTAEVLDFETPLTAGQTRGLELWNAGEIAEAADQFELALKQEQRLWMRREILAELVRCAVRRGDFAAAGSRFQAIWKSDPGTRHLRVIPLLWGAEPVDSRARDAARGWMNGGNEVARLIGASLLLQDAEWERPAQVVLKELARASAGDLGALATWQSRRRDATDGKLNPGELAFWERDLKDLPADLQAGPCYLLGLAFAARHDYELAAAYWMRLPVLCDYDYVLTARATLEAGRALSRIGQKAEAERVFQETATRFAGTTSAREARDLLTSRAPSPVSSSSRDQD